ncbi:hypothetical protein BC830DRAFT_545749 [Chytriomyces sp. MP71]|nr:hypothetical protein BC830DRAFT_545749 [Chytriomyces sp. MP71]
MLHPFQHEMELTTPRTDDDDLDDGTEPADASVNASVDANADGDYDDGDDNVDGGEAQAADRYHRSHHDSPQNQSHRLRSSEQLDPALDPLDEDDAFAPGNPFHTASAATRQHAFSETITAPLPSYLRALLFIAPSEAASAIASRALRTNLCSQHTRLQNHCFVSTLSLLHAPAHTDPSSFADVPTTIIARAYSAAPLQSARSSSTGHVMGASSSSASLLDMHNNNHADALWLSSAAPTELATSDPTLGSGRNKSCPLNSRDSFLNQSLPHFMNSAAMTNLNGTSANVGRRSKSYTSWIPNALRQQQPITSQFQHQQKISSSSHISQTILKVSKLLPTHFVLDAPFSRTSRDNHDMIHLSHGSCRAQYVGPGVDDRDAASVRCDLPVPRQLGVFYFEVKIVSKGRDGWMGIGLCARDVNLNRLPGWEPKSYGYHGDDGFVFESTGKGRVYGPTYTTGDVVGCIINYRDRTISFTKNGLLIGVAFKNILSDVQLYPSVGFRTPGECMDINFGCEAPFKFDIEGYVKDQHRQLLDQIQKTKLSFTGRDGPPPPPVNTTKSVLEAANTKLRADRFSETPAILLHQLIAQHLEHVGYHETAAVFQRTVVDLDREDGRDVVPHNTGTSMETDVDVMDVDRGFDREQHESMRSDTSNLRKQIRLSIMNGDIVTALATTTKHFPLLLSKNSHVHFALKSQQFIELTRKVFDAQKLAGSVADVDVDRDPNLAVIQLGREIMDLFHEDANVSPAVGSALLEIFSIVAFPLNTLAEAVARMDSGTYSFNPARGPGGPKVKRSQMKPQNGVSLNGTSHPTVAVPPSEVVSLYQVSNREAVAGLLDHCLLEELGQMTDSALERIVKQGFVVSQVSGEHGTYVIPDFSHISV